MWCPISMGWTGKHFKILHLPFKKWNLWPKCSILLIHNNLVKGRPEPAHTRSDFNVKCKGCFWVVFGVCILYGLFYSVWVVFRNVPDCARSGLPLTKLLYMRSILHFGHRFNFSKGRGNILTGPFITYKLVGKIPPRPTPIPPSFLKSPQSHPVFKNPTQSYNKFC